MKKKSKNS